MKFDQVLDMSQACSQMVRSLSLKNFIGL